MVATLRAFLLCSILVALSTCSEGPTAPRRPPRVFSVVVAGPTALHPGYRVRFAATAMDSTGATLTGRRVIWRTDNDSVASVDSLGNVQANRLGATVVSATVDSIVGHAPVAIVPMPIGQVRVTSPVESLYVGDSVALHVQVNDSLGQLVTDRPVTWTVSDTLKAAVTPAGMVHVLAAGGFAVRVRCDSVTGGAFLTAQLPVRTVFMPDTLVLGLRHLVRIIPGLVNTAGGEVGGRFTQWTSLDTSVAVVSQIGVVTPVAYGTGRVTVTAEGAADTTVIIVTPEPVTQFTVSISSPTIYVDSAVRFTATPLDAGGYPVPGAPVAWIVTDTTVLRLRPDSGDGHTATVKGLRYGSTTYQLISGSDTTPGGEIPVVLPASRLVLAPDSALLAVGASVAIYVTVQDALSHVIDYVLAHYSVADSTVVRIDSSAPALVIGRAAGRTLVVATYGAFADTFPVVVQAAPYQLAWLYYGNEVNQNFPLPAFEPQPFTVAVTGPQVPATGVTVHLTSSDTTIATVSPGVLSGLNGNGGVTVLGRRAGAARIAAISDSAVAIFSVVVGAQQPASIALTPRPTTLGANDSVRIQATVFNYYTRPMQYPVQWGTSDTALATVSDSGLIHVRRSGVVVVTATAGTVVDSLRIVLVASSPPVIDSAAPRPLVPGIAATLYGSGFDPSPAADTVTLDGVPVGAVGATDSTLTLAMPAAAAFPCRATHWAGALVAAGGRYAPDSVALQVAPQRALNPGDATFLADASAACNELTQTGGTYFLSIANTAATAAQLDLDGELASAPVAAASHAFTTTTLSQPAAPLLGAGSPIPERIRRAAALHPSLLARNRDLLHRVGSPLAALRARRAALRPALSADDTIGALAQFRVPNLNDFSFCGSYTTITARRVYTSAHAIVFEDVAAPLAGQMDGLYAQVASEFDATMYPLLLANFGDPLVLDSLLDGNGRIVMLFTPQVDQYGAEGFVVSCDFFPESLAPSSNTGEVFYARVPTVADSGYRDDTPAEWYREIRTVVMHESKHLTAFANRIARGADFEESWLEEGTAVISEELWARTIYGTAWKGNAGYAQTLYCDVRPSFPQCSGRPYSMFNAFAFLYDYAIQREQHSVFGPTAYGDATFYGSAWSLIRWTTDQYATDESQFLRALMDEPTLTGAGNLAARAGQSFPQLLAQWSLATLFDDRPGAPASAAFTEPSWNMHDIFNGMNADFPTFFGSPSPFQSTSAGYGPLTWSFQLAGGTTTLLSVSGVQPAEQLLRLGGRSGRPLPAGVSVQLLRTQ